MQRRRRRSDEGGSGSEEDYDSDQSYDPEAEEEDDNNDEEQPSVAQNNIVSENKQVIDEEEKEEEIDYVETIEDKKTEKDEARVEQAPSPDQKGRTSQRGRGTRPRGANNSTPRRPSSSIDNRPPLKGSRKGRGRGRGRGDFNRSSDSTTVEAVTADSQVEGDAKSNFKKRREKRRPTKDFNASNTPGGDASIDAKNRDNRPQLKGAKMKSSRRQDKFDPNNPNAPQDVIGAPQQKTFNKHRFDRKNQQQQQQQQQGTGSKRYSVQRQQEFTYDQLQSQQNGARRPRSRYNQDEHYDPNAHYNYPDNGMYSSYMYANYGYEMYADYNVYHSPSSTYIPPEYSAQFYNNGGGTQKVSNYQDSPKSTFGGKLNVHAKEFAPKRIRNLNPVENAGSDKQEQLSQTSEAS